ncbi:hypothetical protein D3C80_968880 [compost metagenome]
MQAIGRGGRTNTRVGHAQCAKEQRHPHGHAQHGKAAPLRQQDLPDHKRHGDGQQDPAQKAHTDLRAVLTAGKQAADHTGQHQAARSRGPGGGQPETGHGQKSQGTARTEQQCQRQITMRGQAVGDIRGCLALLHCA